MRRDLGEDPHLIRLRGKCPAPLGEPRREVDVAMPTCWLVRDAAGQAFLAAPDLEMAWYLKVRLNGLMYPSLRVEPSLGACSPIPRLRSEQLPLTRQGSDIVDNERQVLVACWHDELVSLVYDLLMLPAALGGMERRLGLPWRGLEPAPLAAELEELLGHELREHNSTATRAEALIAAFRLGQSSVPAPNPPVDVEPAPIPLLLICPGIDPDAEPPRVCGARHIDVGKWATRVHHTHSCQRCGHTWRPAVVPTVGVRFLPGFKNEEVVQPVAAPELGVTVGVMVPRTCCGRCDRCGMPVSKCMRACLCTPRDYCAGCGRKYTLPDDLSIGGAS